MVTLSHWPLVACRPVWTVRPLAEETVAWAANAECARPRAQQRGIGKKPWDRSRQDSCGLLRPRTGALRCRLSRGLGRIFRRGAPTLRRFHPSTLQPFHASTICQAMNAVANWEEIPLFDSEEAEAAFWADNRMELRLMEAAVAASSEGSESVTISLRIDPRMLARIKRLARSRYLNYQSMIKQWLSERMEEELRGLNFRGNENRN